MDVDWKPKLHSRDYDALLRSMKRLLLIFALTLLSPLAWGTAYTSVATGNWNSSATWSPAAVPGSGDSVTLANGYTVTIPVSTTATVSSITCSSTTGTGILIINGTLDYKGSMLNQCSANPWICNSCTLTADDASTNIVWNIGYANCDTAPCAVLQLNGTYASQVTVGGTGGSSWSFGGGTYHSSGTIQATWANFTACGTASATCINAYPYPSVGTNTTITYSTFTSCGLIELGYGYANGTTFIFNHNEIVSPISSTGYGLEVQPNGGETGVTYQVENNYLAGTFKEVFGGGAYYGQDDQFIVTGNAFIGTSSVISYDGATVGHATGHFDGNLFVNQLAASTSLNFPAGSITRAVILLSNNTTTQHLVCAGLSPYGATTINGMTYERQYNDGAGLQGTDSCLIPGGGSSSRPAVTIENVVAIPAPNGYSPGSLSTWLARAHRTARQSRRFTTQFWRHPPRPVAASLHSQGKGPQRRRDSMRK